MRVVAIRSSLASVLALVVSLIATPMAATAAPAPTPISRGYTVEYQDGRGHSNRFSLNNAVTARESLVAQTWAACGVSDPASKLVRAFAAGRAPMAPVYIRTVNLRCGNSSYGYRHILAKHSSQWAAIAAVVGSDWRSFTDWAIAQSLSYPYTWCTNTGANTVNYVGLIQIKNSKGQVVGTYYPRVPTGRTSYNIITAFPQGVPTTGC